MLPLELIRREPDRVRHAARLKGETAPVDEILALDEQWRAHLHTAETIKAEQNALSKEFAKTRDEALKERLREMADRSKAELAEAEAVKRKLDDLLLRVPNLFHESVPVGESEADNVVLREWGSKVELGFTARTHYDLGESLGIMDFERAARVAGSRFAFLIGQGALLERALEHGIADAPRVEDEARLALRRLLGPRVPAATDCELTDRALDMKFDPRHLREQIDIAGPDRASTQAHIGRHHVQRLDQHADILQDQRIGDRGVLPRSPAKARSDRDQDLGRGRSVHCEFGCRQCGFELRRANGDRHQRVAAGVVVIETACESLAVGDGQIELELVSTASCGIRPRGVFDIGAALAKIEPAFPARTDARGAVEKP